jgi:hypothetical protein
MKPTKAMCAGCRNNFYNGNNSLGVAECWSFASAEVVTRFRLPTTCPMNIREAYEKRKTLSCYHQSGYVHMKAIPDFAQTPTQRKRRTDDDPATYHHAVAPALR